MKAPGPRGPRLFQCLRNMQRDYVGTCLALREQYGDVVFLRQPLKTCFFFRPDDVEAILDEDGHNICKDVRFKGQADEGVLLSEGKLSRQQRSLLSRPLSPQRVHEKFNLIVACTNSLHQLWNDAAGNDEPREIYRDMRNLMLCMSTAVLFGYDISEKADAYCDALFCSLDDRLKRFMSIVKFPRFLPTPENRRARKADKYIASTVKDIIHRSPDLDTNDSVLEILRDATHVQTGEKRNEEQLQQEVTSLLTAAFLSASSSLSWTLLAIARHPDIESKLVGELSSKLSHRKPTVDDVPRLKYLKMVIEESLRLFPPFPVLKVRRTLKADQIGGYDIPAGCGIVLSPFVTQRHPDYWTDPEQFSPNRFEESVSVERRRLAYFPFGGGPRGCIGGHLAMLEMQLVIAGLVQRFRFLEVPNQKIGHRAVVTLRPDPGIMMTIEKR